MKFIPLELVHLHMIPLNITYYTPKNFNEPDVLTIVYKDQDTNEKIVLEIKEPEIEIYITKPERRTFHHMRDMCEMSECDKYKCKYRTRWSFAAKKLGLNNGEEAKVSPYIFNADIPVETFYLIQFVLEYPTDAAKTLSIGKLDIENDIIQCDDFPVYGETPINAVTYINMETKDVYTLVLLKDHIRHYPKDHQMYQFSEALREKFNRQCQEIIDNPQMVEDACHEKFDELYPRMKYNLLYYTEEGDLIKDLFKIIHQTDNDFIGIWNSPYDMQNLMLRPAQIGLDVMDIIPDDRFSIKLVSFREDTNPQTHKRKHDCKTSTIPSFVDDMVDYAGIRSGRGVLASTKLNYIAQKELKDEKYDYSEVSDIKHLYYDDLLRFILYNIKDVLLLTGIENKTKDMATIYNRMYNMCVFPKEAFTTTKVVWYSLIKFMYGKGYVPGTNRNKGNHHKEIIDYSALLNNKNIEDMNEDEFIDSMFDLEDPESNATEDDPTGKEAVEAKYGGAYVMNTLHMSSTGFKVMGKPSKYIHNNVGDLDVGSEYPSAINTCNISNETLVGKVYFEHPEEIDIPICEGFVFKGKDKLDYKMDVNNFVLEVYTEMDNITFAQLFLGLPSPDEVMDKIKELVG